MSLLPEKIRSSFGILADEKKAPIYFDNACVSLRPDQVVEKMNEYYFKHPACHKRGIHRFAEETSRAVDEAREVARKFIGAQSKTEVIFTKNASEGINVIAQGMAWRDGDTVLVSELEHN